ncbi:MAG: hypothetical protein J7L34_04180 [Thermotogaceae bacterium]|nr:hypothetical protein [Thermotogaceae bacterium]
MENQDLFANRPDFEFIRAFQKQLLELQQQFITLLGKSVFTPDEVEALTATLAQILFMMQEVLPKEEPIEKFWMYWKEPIRFVQKYPEDYYYIIYYKKGHEIHMVPVKSDEELEEKEKEIEHKGYKIIQEKIVPSPELLKEIIEIINKTAMKTGLISLRLPIPNQPLLFDDNEREQIVKETMEKLMEELGNAGKV